MTEAGIDTPHLTPWEIDRGEMMPRSDVDLLSPHTEQPVYEAMVEAIRREGPVAFYDYTRDPGYDGFSFVTDNRLAREVLSHPNIYSSYGTEKGGGLTIHDLPPAFELARKLLIMQPEPDHSRQKQLINRYFLRTPIGELGGFLRARAHELVGNAVEAGSVDFVEAVAAPLPLAAITEILSIPDEERDTFYELGNKINLIDNPPGEGDSIDLDAAISIVAEAEKLRKLIKYGHLDNPVLAALNNAIYYPHKGEQPSDEKFIDAAQFDMFFILLFLAGNETTRNALAHGFNELANHPEQWERLKADPDPKLRESAANEMIRRSTPVRYLRRTTLEPVTLGDAKIEAGKKVVVSLTAANTDPNMFDDPYTFDITRSLREPASSRNSLAFGHGVHFCLGRHLAQLEVESVLGEMLDQVDSFGVTNKPERYPSTLINGLASLVVELQPA